MFEPNQLNSVEPDNDVRIGTNNFVMQGMGPSPLGGDVHESFQVSPNGDVSADHATVQIPGGQRINFKP